MVCLWQSSLQTVVCSYCMVISAACECSFILCLFLSLSPSLSLSLCLSMSFCLSLSVSVSVSVSLSVKLSVCLSLSPTGHGDDNIVRLVQGSKIRGPVSCTGDDRRCFLKRVKELFTCRKGILISILTDPQLLSTITVNRFGLAVRSLGC